MVVKTIDTLITDFTVLSTGVTRRERERRGGRERERILHVTLVTVHVLTHPLHICDSANPQ